MRLTLPKSIFLLAVIFTTTAAQAHVEPGSFLNRPARTTEQLVGQTRSDAQVRDRYMRHFHMSQQDLVDMFSSLHPSRLEQGGAYIVYNVHEDNVIRARVFQLKRGTPVFVDDQGHPILKISCGNPMVAPTPKVSLNVRPGRPEGPVNSAPPAPVAENVPSVVIMPPTPEAPAAIIPAPPVAPSPQMGSVIESSKNSLFILPLLLIINNHGSNCCCQKKQPVPEPASMLIMGFGASAMIIRRRKAKAKV